LTSLFDHTQVAVIIVNWNSGDYLGRCVKALLAQSRPMAKIVVVDNASTDDSLDSIVDLSDAVSIVRQQTNTGFAAANNRGIKECREFSWIALVNPDAFVDSNWLENVLKGINENESAGAIACQMRQANDDSLLDGTGDIYHVSGLAWRRDHGARRDEKSGVTAQNNKYARPVFAPCAAAAIYRRDVLDESGGFDEDYFCYFEDIDLGFRVRLLGYSCVYLPEAVVYHVGSGVTGRDSDFSVYHGHRNLVWTYVKNMPTGLFWRYLPQHILLNLVSIVYYTFKGRGRLLSKAKFDAFKQLGKALKKRKLVQSKRRASDDEIRQFMLGGLFVPYLSRHAG